MRPKKTVEGNGRRGAILSSKGTYLQVAVGFSSISNILFLKQRRSHKISAKIYTTEWSV